MSNARVLICRMEMIVEYSAYIFDISQQSRKKKKLSPGRSTRPIELFVLSVWINKQIKINYHALTEYHLQCDASACGSIIHTTSIRWFPFYMHIAHWFQTTVSRNDSRVKYTSAAIRAWMWSCEALKRSVGCPTRTNASECFWNWCQ